MQGGSFIGANGYPNYDHASFARKNWCHDHFMECEGDCAVCPNKDFFRHFKIEKKGAVEDNGSR